MTLPWAFSTSKPAKLVKPAATISQAVIASSGSKSAGGALNGSIHNGRPLLRSGVQIRTSHMSSSLRARLTSPP